VSDALDTLIGRYLDGTAGAEDVSRLDEQVRSDPSARRALFLAAAMDVHLRECLAEGDRLAGTQDTSSGGACSPARRYRFVWIAAAAAVLAVAVGLGLVLGRYPSPEASGTYRVVGGGQVRRGSVILAEAGTASVALGGYCRVDLDPGSALRIAGSKRAEEVVLKHGRVVCEADRGVGTFAVRSEVGTVSVTGTRFAVTMIEDKGDDDMFDRRMAVRVLAGAVLVSGAWGEMTLRAGQAATVPPPEAVLRKISARLDLPADQQKKIDRMLSTARVRSFRAEYRTDVRGRLFEVAHTTLSSTMPKIMPKKVSPKIRAIRMKLRAGPPKPGDIARIRMTVQKRTRKIMMKVIHKTADDLADDAAADDRLVAWLLSRKIRARLPGHKITILDAEIKKAGITDREPTYFVTAKARVEAAIKGYDPDITGIIDPKTGAIIVSDAESGAPPPDKALTGRVAARLRAALAPLNLTGPAAKKIEAMLTDQAIEGRRVAYCTAVRPRLFSAARDKQQKTLPKKMPAKVQAKVTAIRMRLKLGGPPPKEDIARIQRAMMKRTRPIMMQTLHGTADAVALAAASDERLVAASVAAGIQAKLPADKREAFAAAIKDAGITNDVSAYVTQAEQRIEKAFAAYDPDITGFVDPNTGKVIVKDD